MAYGAKYRVAFSDVYSDTTERFEAIIYKKDYSGSVYELTSNGTPLTIETDRNGDTSYRPIIGSTATLNLLLNESGLYKSWADITDVWESLNENWEMVGLKFDIYEFLIADFDTFYLEIKQDGNVKWRGYYLSTSDTTLDEISPISFTLSFSDLSLMKSSVYYTGTDSEPIGFYAHEKVTLLELALSAVVSAGLNMEIRVSNTTTIQSYYNTFISGVDPLTINNDLSNTYVLKNSLLKSVGQYQDYYTILKSICSQLGLVSYQKNGIFYICSYSSLVNSTSRVFKRYSGVDKSYIADITETDTVIELNSSSFRNIGQTQSVRYSLPYKYISLQSSQAKTNNQDNCYVKLAETRYLGLVSGVPTYQNFISNWKIYGMASTNLTDTVDFRNGSLFPYATIATTPYNYKWGSSSIFPIATTQNNGKYVETENPANVKKGDFVSVSFKYGYDARLNSSYIPQTKVALILKYPDPLNTQNTLSFFLDDNYNSTGQKKFTTNAAYLTGTNISIKNLKIPHDGDLYLRFLLPWSSSYPNGQLVNGVQVAWMYLDYAMIQVYNGNASDDPAGSQKYSTSYTGIKNNKDELALDSELYLFDSSRYYSNLSDDTTPLGIAYTSPMYKASSISNALMTEYYDPIGFQSDPQGNIAGVKTFVNAITDPIAKNNCLPNTTIEGTYKSSMYWIGDKFKYSITGFEERNFVLLDHNTNLKASEQDVVLYSSLFVDSSSTTSTTKLVID